MRDKMSQITRLSAHHMAHHTGQHTVEHSVIWQSDVYELVQQQSPRLNLSMVVTKRWCDEGVWHVIVTIVVNMSTDLWCPAGDSVSCILQTRSE